MHLPPSQETRRRQALIKKACQWRANVASLSMSEKTQTASWRTQSHANLSLRSNSLLTGKRTGILSILGQLAAPRLLFVQ
jgi:hypothetical protein